MRAVDTNVLVRILARDDPRQVRVADAFVAAGAWVSLLALAETMLGVNSRLRARCRRDCASVEQLLNHKDLILQDREVVAAALEIFRSRPALGFTDCVLLEVARKAGHLPLAHSTAIWARSMGQKNRRRIPPKRGCRKLVLAIVDSVGRAR